MIIKERLKNKFHAVCLDMEKNIPFLFITLTIGVLARFFVMTLGHNYDFDSYKIVGEIVRRGGNVYAETTRYNYAPLFFFIQGLGYKIASINTPEYIDLTYRVYIISVLTLADVGITSWIYKNFSTKAAILFFLNPISIIITGYHNQFDNIAVFFALLSINYVNDESENLTKNDFIAIGFLSLSLITKHILFMFFCWLLFRQKKWTILKKMTYVCAPIMFFLASFFPFVIKNKAAFNGVLENVFLYRSYNNYPLFRIVFMIFPVPVEMYFPIYVFIMMVIGFLLRKRSYRDLIMIYLVATVAFSSAIANQYLIIPIAALVTYRKKIYFRMYECLGIVYCFLNGNELHFKWLILYHFPSMEAVVNLFSEWHMTILMATVLAVMILLDIYEEYKGYLKDGRQDGKNLYWRGDR